MRRMQIKTKVTLWYSIFMVALMILMFLILIYFSESLLMSGQKTQLSEVVEDQIEDLMEEDEEEEFHFYEEGVYFLLYSSNGEYERGQIPKGFDEKLPLQEGIVQKQEGTSYYYYDRFLINENGKEIWLRGVSSNVGMQSYNLILLNTFFIIIPILVVISCIVGYGITKRAFLPIRRIQETAEKIIASKELSTRIALPEGKDEISKLGQTFDHMLDILEQNFAKEKQFTSDASHELRTPITVIMTESEFALKHADTMEEMKESMEVVKRQADKMSGLLQHLLFLARADAGTQKIQPVLVNVTELTKEMANELVSCARKRNMTITFTQKEQEDVWMMLDQMLYMRAVENLIQNAISYGKESDDIHVEIQREDGGMVVSVTDHGIGISKENLPKIWDRFFQVDEARSKENGSMGLGLSMVKWIVESHGGEIMVESKEQEGSKFSLRFPKR